jgi:hypothetical protein
MSTELRSIVIHHIKASPATLPNSAASDQDQMPNDTVPSAVKGYPRLARLMHSSPKTAIFRSFAELSLTNLLRMQSELHCLEQRLALARELDARSEDRRSHACSFKEMRDNVSIQQDLLIEIDVKLERYGMPREHPQTAYR